MAYNSMALSKTAVSPAIMLHKYYNLTLSYAFPVKWILSTSFPAFPITVELWFPDRQVWLEPFTTKQPHRHFYSCLFHGYFAMMWSGKIWSVVTDCWPLITQHSSIHDETEWLWTRGSLHYRSFIWNSNTILFWFKVITTKKRKKWK